MKVLKSPLAQQVLADPKATDQLRRFVVSRGQDGAVIELRSGGRIVRLKPKVVPKAA